MYVSGLSAPVLGKKWLYLGGIDKCEKQPVRMCHISILNLVQMEFVFIWIPFIFI